MIPAQLLAEVDELCKEGMSIDFHEEGGWALVLVHDYPVLPGFSSHRTELLLKLPLGYPNGKPDMFWTSSDLLLKSGAVPKNADLLESSLGKQWRRFSWHLQAWHPGRDSLRTFLEFVNRRLAQPI